MREERCGNCRWWVTTYYQLECRRHPPTAWGDEGRPRWPMTLVSDWCGEHTPLPGSPSGGDSGEDA